MPENNIISCIYLTKKTNIYENASTAVKDIADGSKLWIGGSSRASKISVVSNNAGMIWPIGNYIFYIIAFEKEKCSKIKQSIITITVFFCTRCWQFWIITGLPYQTIDIGASMPAAFFTSTAFGTLIHVDDLPIEYSKDENIEIASAKRICGTKSRRG